MKYHRCSVCLLGLQKFSFSHALKTESIFNVKVDFACRKLTVILTKCFCISVQIWGVVERETGFGKGPRARNQTCVTGGAVVLNVEALLTWLSTPTSVQILKELIL